MIKNQMFIAAALLAGVAIGYFVKTDAPQETPTDETHVVASKIDNAGEAASVNALRARVAELERALRERTPAAAQTKKTASAIPDVQSPTAQQHRPGRDMREHMEWMAKEKPEEFAQMTNAMARWRQRRVERAHSKLDLLSSVNTATMTDEQKKTHESYQDLLVRREELEEKMHNQEMTDEDRDDIMRDMHETERALRQAANQERETLISQTIQSLGYSDDDAADISEVLSDIISVTETRGGGPGGGPGGMPPAGGQPPSGK